MTDDQKAVCESCDASVVLKGLCPNCCAAYLDAETELKEAQQELFMWREGICPAEIAMTRPGYDGPEVTCDTCADAEGCRFRLRYTAVARQTAETEKWKARALEAEEILQERDCEECQLLPDSERESIAAVLKIGKLWAKTADEAMASNERIQELEHLLREVTHENTSSPGLGVLQEMWVGMDNADYVRDVHVQLEEPTDVQQSMLGWRKVPVQIGLGKPGPVKVGEILERANQQARNTVCISCGRPPKYNGPEDRDPGYYCNTADGRQRNRGYGGECIGADYPVPAEEWIRRNPPEKMEQLPADEARAIAQDLRGRLDEMRAELNAFFRQTVSDTTPYAAQPSALREVDAIRHELKGLVERCPRTGSTIGSVDELQAAVDRLKKPCMVVYGPELPRQEE